MSDMNDKYPMLKEFMDLIEPAQEARQKVRKVSHSLVRVAIQYRNIVDEGREPNEELFAIWFREVFDDMVEAHLQVLQALIDIRSEHMALVDPGLGDPEDQ